MMNSLVIVLFLICSEVYGASPLPTYEYVTGSERSGGVSVFVMVPSEKDPHDGFGYCLSLGKDGIMVKQWNVEGWYAFPPDIFLARDGKSLVRINQLAGNDGLSGREVAVTFFSHGKESGTLSLNDAYGSKDYRAIPMKKSGPELLIFKSVELIDVLEFRRKNYKDNNWLSEEIGDSDQVLSIITWEGKMRYFSLSNGRFLYEGAERFNEDLDR